MHLPSEGLPAFVREQVRRARERGEAHWGEAAREGSAVVSQQLQPPVVPPAGVCLCVRACVCVQLHDVRTEVTQAAEQRHFLGAARHER